MSDYKLVPVEPTPEMEQAGGAVYWKNIEDVCEIYSAMLAAAPAVQGEPVGEVRLELGAQPYVFAELYSESPSVLAPGTKLYAAPQPAEQQPDDRAAARLDKQCREDVAAALGFIRGGNYAWSYLVQQIKDIASVADKQPAPDVAGLVEALESLIKGYVGLLEAGMDRITSLGGDCDPVPVMEQNDPWLRDARAALAAHRKQKEPIHDNQ